MLPISNSSQRAMILSTYSKLLYEKLSEILVVVVSYSTLKEAGKDAIIRIDNPIFQRGFGLFT